MQDKLISVIIVNWNGRKWLEKCLNSLTCQRYKKFELIFVDNASDDDSVKFVESIFRDAIIIKNDNNLGFGTANNIGVEKSRGEVFFFLNNDTELFPDTLEKLMKHKEESGINILSPKILDKDGNFFKKGTYSSGLDFLGTPIGPSNKLFYIEGCSLMIDRRDFLKLGGFDKKYFMYSEDIDLCWRAHLYGMKIGICYDSEIIHFGGGSSQETRYRKNTQHVAPLARRYEVEKNNLRNLLKNYRLFNLVWVIQFFLLQEMLEVILYLVSGNFKMIKIIYKAMAWNVINIADTMEKRRIIQKSRVIGDYIIFSKMNIAVNKIIIFFRIGLPKFK